KTDTELATAFAELSASVRFLDLGSNHLNDKTGPELAAAFRALPRTITSLNLEWNDLAYKTAEELTTAFAAFIPNVKTLKLGQSDLVKRTGAINIDFLSALPTSITTLIVDEQSLHPLNYLLGFVFPEVMAILASKDEGSFIAAAEHPIQASCEIDDILLKKMLAFFEKHQSPKGYLICGLLLEGLIENTADEDPNPEFYRRRAYQAIEFYRKAGSNAELRPIAKHLLWHMRIRCHDMHDIIEVLDQDNSEPLLSSFSSFKPRDSEELFLKRQRVDLVL
ncbi:MAG: hypothetical protein EBY16_08660, partial [Gammaproteobacteria bacterium]|nr:hypothetical protein [Gammaproteobacteria bacterium]